MGRTAVAVVSFNTCDVLEACLDSIPSGEASKILVMDQGSSDGSVEMVRSRFPSVEVHVDPSNAGYAAAINRAMAVSSEAYLIVLNSDTILRTGSIRALEAHMDGHPEVAVVGPRLLNPDGSLQPSQFPFPHPVLTPLHLAGLDGPIRWIPGLDRSSREPSAHEGSGSVPWVSGAAMALRRSAFELLEGFREGYFMYWEETDYCRRAHLAGWDVHFTPDSELVHIGGVSTAQVGRPMRLRLFQSLVLYHRLNGGRLDGSIASALIRSSAVVKTVTTTLRLLATRDRTARDRLEEARGGWLTLALGGWAADARAVGDG